MEEKIGNILSQIAAIVQQDREQKEKNKKNGECFNLFDVLKLNTSEKVHSTIIAELLDPNGRHGFADTFLQAFIETISCLKNWNFNTSEAYVQTELPIGPINKNYTQGGFVDIWIESQGHAIIIENKIYAPDQPKQLIRYRNHAERLVNSGKLSGYLLIYLTLAGGEASPDSTKNQLEVDKDYYTIGYSEIIEWLKVCESKSSQDSILCNTITQYKNVVDNLIHQDMLPENSDKIVEIMSHPENIEAVIAIHNHIGDWNYKIVEKYLIPQLQEWAENNNLNFKQHGFLDEQDGFGFYFYRNEWMRSAIWIYTERRIWKDFYIDISSRDGKSLKGYTNKYQIFIEHADINAPFGWEYLDEYCSWDNNTMIDIVNGKVAEYIIERVKEVLDKISEMGIKMP